jgi:adenine deaminase
MNDRERRDALRRVALGEQAPDMVVSGVTVFNALTGEFLEDREIRISGGRIAYVGPWNEACSGAQRVIRADGMVALPGLIEGHTHMINRVGIEEYIRHVMPGGVTTVVTETIELATVVGLEGIEQFVGGLKGQPVRFYYTVAPLCGLTLEQEVHAPPNEALLPLLQDPRCLGVGEIYWGNMLLPGPQGKRVRELASMALDFGKRVEGHTAGARGSKLQSYVASGVTSCHEPITEEEVMERLRLGMYVMIRQGGIRKELDGVKGVFRRNVDTRALILSTDSVDPEGFLEEGYLDAAVRTALHLGVPPAVVFQMVTVNVADYFRLGHLVGSIAPGKMADLVLIPDANDFSPQLVICEGKVVYEGGQCHAEPRETTFPEHFLHTVKVSDMPWPLPPNSGRVRAMEQVTRLVTRESVVDLDDSENTDMIKVLALDRSGSDKAFMGWIKGYGLRRGACGSTMCWDTTDMVVVGRDLPSMVTVVGRLRELGGGAVHAVGNDIVAEFPAPLCGMVSRASMRTARDQLRSLEDALRRQGVPWEKPVLTIDTMGTAAIPHLRITHGGYVRLKDRAVLPVEI